MVFYFIPLLHLRGFMVARLFLLFSMMSLAEIYVLIKVGSVLGAFSTVALILVSAMVGASLVRAQGLQTAFTAQRRMAKGEVPAQQMIEGLMLVISGVMLITPGFITDSLGLLLLVPQLRLIMVNKLLASVGDVAGFKAQSGASFSHDEQNPSHLNEGKGQTIEGEFERRD